MTHDMNEKLLTIGSLTFLIAGQVLQLQLDDLDLLLELVDDFADLLCVQIVQGKVCQLLLVLLHLRGLRFLRDRKCH